MPLFRAHDTKATHHRPGDAGQVRAVPKAQKKIETHTPVLLLIIVLASLATLLWYRAFLGKFERGMHNAIIAQLHQLFPDVTVQLGRVAADGAGRIVVNNVRMKARKGNSPRTIITIQRTVLQGDLDIANWAQKTSRVEQIHLYGVRIDAWPLADGTWSIQSLKPRPNADSRPPTIHLDDATVRLFSNAETDARVVAVHDIQGRITPVAAANSAADGSRSQPKFVTQLTCRSTGLVRQVKLDGQFDPIDRAWLANGTLEDFSFSPKLIADLPPQLAQYLSQLSGLECQASCTFKASSTGSEDVKFDIQGTIASGRLRDRRLPYPLEDLKSDFFCNNKMLQLRSMHAKSGGAELELSSDIMGFGQDVPMVIHAKATNLELDSRLYESLPDSLQKQWDRLQPSGHVSGTIQLSFDGAHWTPIASIQCESVALKPWLFPYPLSDVQGLVYYQNGTFSSERLIGLAGGQPVESSFSLSRSGTEWYGKLSGLSQGPIAIDEQLISALTPRDQDASGVEKFVRSLHPSGSVEVTRVNFERSSPQDPTWHRTIDANVYDARITYDYFKYQILDIRGRVACQDDNWWLQGFEGRNDSGRILCSGNWQSVSQGDIPFDLRFQAFAVPIEEELQRALPADAQFIWDELRPSGSIDRVQVQLARRPDEKLTTRVWIEEVSASNQAEGRSLRIHPRSLPLWLTDIDCQIAYEPGHVRIDSASGVNGDSRLSIRGDCLPREDGRWQANVEWQPRTRIIVDSQLLRALPKSIRDSLVRIDFRGPVSALGRSQILFPNQLTDNTSTAWDCQFDVENGQLGDGKSIGAMRGTVWMKGDSDGTNIHASGSIAMDALTIQDIPVTRMRGPFAIVDSTLYFGAKVIEEFGPPSSPDQLSEMTADALTGRLTLSGFGLLDTGKFYLNAKLQNAELNTLLREVGVDRANTQASCEARIDFSGIPWNSQTWHGEGDIQLTDAKLFELPFMIRLLRTASVNADNEFAFQTADIHFEIDGDKIPLNIKCDGEVLRLRGEGWTNLRKEVDLQLYSYVGRRPIYSVVSPLLPESPYATFMMIQVSGTLDSPNMQRIPFPQLEATLQQIFPEVAEGNRGAGLMPWR